MKKLSILFALFLLAIFFILPAKGQAATLKYQLRGRILIEVQSHGEAWYVSPVTQKRFFLGSPSEAFEIIKEQGLGITNNDLKSFGNKAPARLSGRILIDVDDSGKAYYVYPVNLTLHYLGSPFDAFTIMQQLGLGITEININQIPRDISIPQIEVRDQTLINGNVTIAEVNALKDGWVVINKSINNEPGAETGHTFVKAGEHFNVKVNVGKQEKNETFFAILHYDYGQKGIFESSAIDKVVYYGTRGKMVDARFFLREPGVKTSAVQIRNNEFSPKILKIVKGSTVEWTNYTDTTHTITSTGNFDSGDIQSSKSYSRVFNAIGNFSYHCIYNPGMTGLIQVVSTE